MLLGYLRQYLFDLIQIAPAQMNLTEHVDAVVRKIGNGKPLIREPVERGGVALHAGDDGQERVTGIGILSVTKQQYGGLRFTTRFEKTRARRQVGIWPRQRGRGVQKALR